MTWGELEIKVHFNRIPKIQIRQKHEEAVATIERCERKLLQLATATPRDSDELRWEDYVECEVGSLVNALIDASAVARALSQAIDEPERVLESE